MNQQALLRKIQKMQEEMEQAQAELEATSFHASSGGVVTVELKGTKELVGIKISEDFEVESEEDLEMLADMVVAACNQAYRDIEKTTEEKLGKYTDMLGGFGGFGGF